MGITHAGSPVVIDNVEYELSFPTLEDFEYLNRWIRSQSINSGRMSLPPGATEEEERRMMIPICEAANKLDLFSRGNNAFEQLLSPIGASHLLQRLLRRHHPEVTANQCFKWMLRVDVRNALMPEIVAMFKTTAIGKEKEVEDDADDDKEGERKPKSRTTRRHSSKS